MRNVNSAWLRRTIVRLARAETGASAVERNDRAGHPGRLVRGEEERRPRDVVGLLLRERIVFLGNQVDDFTADAVISQLLLLDAQDPKKVWRFSTRYYEMRSTI